MWRLHGTEGHPAHLICHRPRPQSTFTREIEMTELTAESFDVLALSLGLAFVVNAASNCPGDLARLLTAKVKMAARRLARVSHGDEASAYDAVAGAIGFASGAALDAHLARGPDALSGRMADDWRQALAPCVVLLAEPPAGHPLSDEHVDAFERFAQALSARTGLTTATLLDEVCARACFCTRWSDARLGHTPSPDWVPTVN